MKLTLMILALLIIPIAMATTYTDVSLVNVILQSTDINLTINILGTLNTTQLDITNESIDFTNITYNPLGIISLGDMISYNLTMTNKLYTGTDLPYVSLSTTMRKQITSNLAGYQSGTFYMKANDCAGELVSYYPATGNHQVIAPTSCDSATNLMRIDFTNLTVGVNTFYIDEAIATNCTEGNISLTFSIYDEDTPTLPLNADAEVEFNYWKPEDPSFVRNFTLSYTGGNNYSICLSNNVSILNADLYIQYTTSGGFTHRYILANNTLSVASPQLLSLYNFNTTTGISNLRLTTRNYNTNNFYPNIIAKLQRLYLGEGVWRTVQMDKSGDYGLMTFHVKEQSTDYRIIYTDMSNNVLKTTASMKFACSADYNICELTQLLLPYSASSSSNAVSIAWEYIPSSNSVNTTWTDPLGGTNTVKTKLIKDTYTGTVVLCDETQTGASGVVNCATSGYTGEAFLTIYANDQLVVSEWVGLNTTRLGDAIDRPEGAWWAGIIILTCAMFGLMSPAVAIIAMIIGMIAVFMLGIFTPLTMTMLVVATILGIAVGWKVRN
jgi:hypothetical protein